MKAALTTAVGIVLLVAGIGLGYGLHKEATTQPVAIKAGSNGPISPFNYFCNAGVCEYFGSEGLNPATSTPAAIQSPAATSTLGSTSLRLDVASSSATFWNIAVASTPFASTTVIATYTVPANTQAFIQASTTPGAGASAVIPPNSYIVVKEANGITSGDTAGTGFAPIGRFRAQFTTTDQ